MNQTPDMGSDVTLNYQPGLVLPHGSPIRKVAILYRWEYCAGPVCSGSDAPKTIANEKLYAKHFLHGKTATLRTAAPKQLHP